MNDHNIFLSDLWTRLCDLNWWSVAVPWVYFPRTVPFSQAHSATGHQHSNIALVMDLDSPCINQSALLVAQWYFPNIIVLLPSGGALLHCTATKVKQHTEHLWSKKAQEIMGHTLTSHKAKRHLVSSLDCPQQLELARISLRRAAASELCWSLLRLYKGWPEPSYPLWVTDLSFKGPFCK